MDALAWADALITFDSGRTCAVCMIQGFVAAVHVLDDGAITLFHRPEREATHAAAGATELLGKMHAGMLTEQEIVRSAVVLREGKHRYITLGCIAAQFYDAIRDVESLRSMAAFYVQQRQPIPLDIVLYGGGTLREVGGRLLATIPEVGARAPRNRAEAERSFAVRATPAFEDAPVAGRVPWMRQAWGAVATARGDRSLEAWRRSALDVIEYLGPGNFTNVTADGRSALAALARVDLHHEPAPARSHHGMMG